MSVLVIRSVDYTNMKPGDLLRVTQAGASSVVAPLSVGDMEAKMKGTMGRGRRTSLDQVTETLTLH
jgi:hypothetical protein